MRLLYNEIAMKILIVDDEEPIRELIKYNVEKQKYETFTAENGQQALELCRNKNPDLVILDLMLPDMSGLVTQKLGVKFDEVKTNRHTTFGNVMARPFNADETAILQAYVNRGNKLYRKRVEDGQIGRAHV